MKKEKANEWFKRANELRDTDKTRAIEAYTKAIQSDPYHEESYYNRALTFSELGRVEEAVSDQRFLMARRSAHAETLTSLFRLCADANVSLGNDAFEKKNWDLALERYSDALLYDPMSSNALVGRALVYQAKGNLDRAVAEFGRAIEIDPQSAVALHNRAEAHLSKRQFSKAVEDFTQVIELEPEEPAGYEGRARAYDGMNEKEKAREDRQSAGRIQRQNEENR